MYSDDDDDEDEEDTEKPNKISGKTQRILEKGRANLQRSKSELGEQHRRMISHLSRSRNELRAQNRRVIASLSSGVERGRRRINRKLQGSFKNGGSSSNFPEMNSSFRETSSNFREVGSDSRDTNGFHEGSVTLRANNGEFKENRSSNGDLRRLDLSPVPSHRSLMQQQSNFPGSQAMSASLTMARPPPARDLDAMLMDLGIDPISNGISNDLIIKNRDAYSNGANFEPLQREPTALEIRLEEGYGEEFEFMDGVATIKRGSESEMSSSIQENFREMESSFREAREEFEGTLKRNEEEDKYDKTDSGFADEVFTELSKSSTFKRGSQQQQQQQQHYQQQQQQQYSFQQQQPGQQQQRWSFKRRDSLSYLPNTDIGNDSGTSSPKLSGGGNFPGNGGREYPGNGMSSVELSSVERRRQKRIRRLSAQSYTNGASSNLQQPPTASNNLSYESIVNANYEEDEEVNNGSNHRLDG